MPGSGRPSASRSIETINLDSPVNWRSRGAAPCSLLTAPGIQDGLTRTLPETSLGRSRLRAWTRLKDRPAFAIALAVNG